MKKRRRRRDRRPLIAVLLIILLAIAAFFLLRYMPSNKKKNLYDYYQANKGEGAVLVLGEERLEERGKIVDSTAYLPLALVQEKINSGFYWNEDTAEIYYTLPSSLDKWPSSETGGEVLLSDGQVYLSLGLIKRYTDLDTYVYTEPDRIILRNQFDSLSMVRTRKKAAIRFLAGIKADVLSKVPSGTDLVYLGEEGSWYLVSTWDGYKGYVAKNQVGGVSEVSLPRTFTPQECSFIKIQEPVNLGFAMVTNMDANDTVLANMQDMTGVNVICPTWFSLSSESGEFDDYSSSYFTEQAHARGLQVWGLIDNFSGVSTYETLRHSSVRERLVENLVGAIQRVGADGINIDFEGLTYDSAPHVVQFLRELSIRTHAEGLVLSFDNPPPEGYTGHYQRLDQAQVVDYNVIMGYDEHYQGDEFAGSVASYPWVEQGIIDTIEEFPAERSILAVPFYTRAWYEQAGSVNSQIIYMYEQDEVLALRAPDIYWNTELRQYVATWTVEGTDYTMWMEEENSLRDKVSLAKKYGLAGIAFWRLGFEKNEIWSVLTEALSS